MRDEGVWMTEERRRTVFAFWQVTMGALFTIILAIVARVRPDWIQDATWLIAGAGCFMAVSAGWYLMERRINPFRW
jgi:hypothetical protein